MSDLSAQFELQMLDIYHRAKTEAGYNATIFFKMLAANGGVNTAKALIRSPNPSAGYTALYLRNRLDLTVEAVIVENQRWHPLFTIEDIERASRRLKEYEYKNQNKYGDPTT